MSGEQFIFTIVEKNKLHQIVVDAKNETSARLAVLTKFKNAVIVSAHKVSNTELFKNAERFCAIEIPNFLLKKNSMN